MPKLLWKRVSTLGLHIRRSDSLDRPKYQAYVPELDLESKWRDDPWKAISSIAHLIDVQLIDLDPADDDVPNE